MLKDISEFVFFTELKPKKAVQRIYWELEELV